MLTHQTAVAWNVLASGVTSLHGQSTGAMTQLVAQQSSMVAYNYLFRVCAIVFVLVTPLIFFISTKKRTAGAPSAMAVAAAD
jgi:hypothetical protein